MMRRIFIFVELCMFWFNRDVFRGRENIFMAVINGVDDDLVFIDF